jgi:CheY-like chemotaxis protein
VRILIVEDSPLVQSMYGLAFPQRQHELVAARNGREALARLDDGRFDVILLDLRMPDMDGVAFLRAAAGRLGAVPVVLTTVEPDGSELLAEARALGVAAVVKKPWKPKELRDLVEALVR